MSAKPRYVRFDIAPRGYAKQAQALLIRTPDGWWALHKTDGYTKLMTAAGFTKNKAEAKQWLKALGPTKAYPITS